MVCPTCFCTTVEDVTDLTGTEAERRQVWDSCFTLDFSYLHGGGVRTSPRGALPALADAQARHLARPVRQLGLRRLRALHRLVPRRDRHHRGGRGDQGGAGMSIRTIEQLLVETRLFADLAAQPPRDDRRLRRDRPLRGRRVRLPRGRRRRHLLRPSQRQRRARDPRARARPRAADDHPRRGRARLVMALPALPLALRRRALEPVRALAFDGACLREKSTTTTSSATS